MTVSGGIEDTILSNIEANSGDSFVNDGPTADPVDPGTDVQQDQATQQLNQRDPFEQAVDEQPKGKQPSKAETKQPAKDEKPQRLKEQVPDKSHNQAHAERRLQSTVDRLRDVSKGLEKQNQGLVQQLAETKALNGLPQQFGLSNDEVIGGLEYVALLKQSPAQAAKKAIEVALARGANLRDIVNDEFVPNLTLNAVQQLIDQRLGPVARNLQQQQDVGRAEAQHVEAARQKTAQFLADYPDAEPHSEVVAAQISRIMDDYSGRGMQIDPYIAAEMAWNSVRDFAARNQLDLNQPLGPQYQARQQQPQTQQPTRRPMPNGSNAPVRTRSDMAKTDDTTRSIVRQAMIESGYNFNS
jgi:hypothetical protein